MRRRLSLFVSIGALLGSGWLHASEYPPSPGTDRSSEAWFDAAEAFLQDLDLNDRNIVFERLGGTTATNWAVKVNGARVANLKCTSGNTNHHGAVVAYRLGRELGFNIYPVAVYRNVKREIGGRRVNEQCALKEWSSIFTQYYWTRDTFRDTDDLSKRRLVHSLHCEAEKPGGNERYDYGARSAYGHPKISGVRRVPYAGTSTLPQAARDFSNMMVIDTLIGNEDRFPGGNLFFRSVTTTYREDGGRIVYDDARIYSLDNEAAFKGAGPGSTHAARDLGNHVGRFDANLVSDLRALRDDDDRLRRITDNSSPRMAYLQAGIDIVLEQYGRSAERCGADAARF